MDVRQHPEDQERDKDQIYDVSDRNEPVAAPPQGRWVNDRAALGAISSGRL